MIKLRRSIDAEFSYTVDFHVRKEAIIGVFEIRKRARIILISGQTIETENSEEEILKLLDIHQ